MPWTGERVLFVGDDWSEEHHDVELMDHDGRVLARARLSEGAAGMTRLHTMIGEHTGGGELVVRVGIETDRGLWVMALAAAGYEVFAINPLQTSRYRDRHVVSGGKSDTGDAHVLADMVRTDSHQLRQIPAAREAFGDLDAPDALELLAKAPDPASAARLSTAQVSAVLKRARRRDIAGRAAVIRAAFRDPQLAQPPQVTAACASVVRALTAVLATLNEQITVMEAQVDAHFLHHPDAEIILSQPGLGLILGARVLAEFGDDPARYASAKARKNYAATSPITRKSGKKKTVLARYVHNDRLIDALDSQAFCALSTSPGARAYYDRQKERGISHHAALRQLANRLVGILHGCLKTRTLYDEETAWPQAHSRHISSAA